MLEMKMGSAPHALPWEEQRAHHSEKLDLIGSLRLPHLHANRGRVHFQRMELLGGGKGADREMSNHSARVRGQNTLGNPSRR